MAVERLELALVGVGPHGMYVHGSIRFSGFLLCRCGARSLPGRRQTAASRGFTILFAGVGAFQVAQNAAATGGPSFCAAVLGCATFFARADLALFDAGGAKNIVGGFL